MKQPDDLIKLQINLEYQLDREGLLVPFPGSSEQALYIVYRSDKGYTHFFSYLLPLEIRWALLVLDPKHAFDQADEVIKLISNPNQQCTGGEDIFWSGYFSKTPEEEDCLEVIHQAGHWVINVDDRTVCQAMSIRQNECCAEVYVETLADYRRRGYARQAVAAWAIDVLNYQRVALYSYRKQNQPSAALARSLGIEWFADVVAYGRSKD